MYLSMWMILKGLKNYHPEPHITEGAMCIRNASLLYPGEPAGTHTVYLCPAEQYISGSGNKIICVTRNDYILIDCDDLEELFHQVTALIDFYLEWDLQARDRIQENCSLQELLELAEPVMNSLILVTGMDFSYEAIAGSRGYRHYDLLRDSLHPGGRLPDKYLRNYTDTFFSERANLQPFIYEERSLKEKLLVQSLIVEHQNVGSLVCIPNGTLNQPLFQLFSVLHSQIHLWKSQHMEFSRPLIYEELLLRMLQNRTDSSMQDSMHFFDLINWTKADRKYLCCMEHPDTENFAFHYTLHYLSGLYPRLLTVIYQKYYVILLNDAIFPLQDFLSGISQKLPEALLYLGISYPFFSWEQTYDAFCQSRIALQYGKENSSHISHCSDYLPEYIRRVLQEHVGFRFANPFLITLQAYDAAHQTAYLETLRTYLAKERSLVRTAQALHIHVNTLKYRLKRIQDLGCPDLENDRIRQQLTLTFFFDL